MPMAARLPALRLLLLLGMWGKYGGGLGAAEGWGVLGPWLLYPGVPAVPVDLVPGVPRGTQPRRSPEPLQSHGETPRLSCCQAAGHISGGLSPVPSAGAHRCSCLGSVMAPCRGSHVPALGKPQARRLGPGRGRGAGDQRRGCRAHSETRAVGGGGPRPRPRTSGSPSSGGPQDAHHTPGVSLQVLGSNQPSSFPASSCRPQPPLLIHMAQRAAAGTVPLRLTAVMVAPSAAAWPYLPTRSDVS